MGEVLDFWVIAVVAGLFALVWVVMLVRAVAGFAARTYPWSVVLATLILGGIIVLVDVIRFRRRRL